MAYGPCGEQFRAAFSCFVFSKEEPKGMDCIEHFKTMQNCFREHPDVYGSELEDDEAPQEEVEGQQAPVQSDTAPLSRSATTETPSRQAEKMPEASAQDVPQTRPTDTGKREHVETVSTQEKEEHQPISESDELMPKAWHDARQAPQSN